MLAPGLTAKASSRPSVRTRAFGNWIQGLTRSKAVPDLPDTEPAFTAWLMQQGLPQQQLAVQQLEGQGRALVATAPIRKGQALLNVPEQLLITPQLAATVSLLVLQHPELAEKLPEWTLLALFLAELRFHYQQHQQQPGQHRQQPAESNTHRQTPSTAGQQQQPLLQPDDVVLPADVAGNAHAAGSMEEVVAAQAAYFAQWFPYYELLPQQTGCVLDWPPGEAQKLLQRTLLLQKANTLLDAATATWQELQPYLTSPGPLGPPPPAMYTKETMNWALNMCLTRSVRLDSRGGLTVLVPWADLLNHDTAADCYLDWDADCQAVVLRPDRDCRPGEQVFISYGPKASGELLLCYGFHPPLGSNPHESTTLGVQLDPADPLYEQKAAAMAIRGIPTKETFALRMDALPAGLLPYLALTAAPPSLSGEVEELSHLLFDRGELPVLGSVNTEVLAWQDLARRCNTLLKGYDKHAMERCKTLAQTVPGGGGMEQRVALAAAVRLREQQILARTEYIARQQTKQLSKQQR